MDEIKQIQLTYLSEKDNAYGSNNFFEVLDVEPLHISLN